MEKFNLIAFCLPIALFSFWCIVGYATLSLLHSQRNLLQNILIAPTVGIAITLLHIFWLSRAGFPVKNFATTLTIILFFCSAAILLWKKPLFPLRHYFLFAVILILSLFLTGRPLLEFGFNWLSFGNDDMTNYCLSAIRLLSHGYSETFNVNDIISGRNYSLHYWLLLVAQMIRSGADLLLAWTSSITGLSPLQIFMPLILTFHISLISAMAAFIYKAKYWRNIALTATLLLGCSSLMSIGTLYQLIAQVLGISLMIAVAVFLLHPFNRHQKYIVLRQSLLICITVSALLISYPEVTPFLFISIVLYFVALLLSKWKPKRGFWWTAVFSILFLGIFLNQYWINFVVFMKSQMDAGFSLSRASIFPYFLIPSGIANLWNLQILAKASQEPWQSLSILLGFILLIIVLKTSIVESKRKLPVAIILLVMLIFGFALFVQKNGFALFKIAMYLQPFLICMLVIATFSLIKNNIAKFVLIGLYAGVSLYTQSNYINFSRGDGQIFSELHRASITGLTDELTKINLKLPSNQAILFDTSNIVVAKLLAINFLNKETRFYSADFFKNLKDDGLRPGLNTFLFKKFMPSEYEFNIKKSSELSNANKTDLQFVFQDANNARLINTIFANKLSIPQNSVILLSTPIRTVFNRRKFSNVNTNYIALPLKQATNYLIFTDSDLGTENYLANVVGRREHITLFNLEADYFNKDSTLTAIGQYLLLQAINPSPQVRLELSITESTSGDKKNLLPNAYVIGTERIPLPLMGRGSARIFSPPIKPQVLANNSYLMLDMGEAKQIKRSKELGLLSKILSDVYKSKNLFERRKITGFARDISLVSNEEYNNLNAPHYIHLFPEDLTNPNLEYSGIYEDGLISEDAFFMLAQPNQDAKLVIKGEIFPFLNQLHSSILKLVIDGKVITEHKLKFNNFDLILDIPYIKKNRKIELHFSKSQPLPGKDGRPVSAKINFIGFKIPFQDAPTYLSHFSKDLMNPDMEFNGIYRDGWVSKKSFVGLMQKDPSSELSVRGSIPPFLTQPTHSKLQIVVDNNLLAEQIITAGKFNLKIPISNNKKYHKIELRFDKDQMISPKDKRVVAAKIDFIGFKNIG